MTDQSVENEIKHTRDGSVTELKIGIEDEGGQLKTLAARLERSLSALEKLPEFPLHEFLRLGNALTHDVSVSAGCTAPSAGDGRIVLRAPLHLEVFASALTALEGYLCHERSPSLG